MNLPLYTLKNEKLTFVIVISILLFSLIYISGYTLGIREENEKFKQEIKAIQREISLLFEFLPSDDAVSIRKKEHILRQIDVIEDEFYANNVSVSRKQALLTRLDQLKQEVSSFKEHIKTALVPPLVESSPLAASQTYEENPLPVAGVMQREPAAATPVQVIVQHKWSVYYFNAFSSDRKNRHQRTRYLEVKLQLRGITSGPLDPYIGIEVRDPQNRIISKGTERIRATENMLTSYQFSSPDHTYLKGRYSIRIYKPDADFHAVTFIDLI